METEYVKLISAFTLLFVTFACTMMPVFIFKNSGETNRTNVGRRNNLRIMSFLNCFGGGVFLATCLLHLFPDVREQMDIVFKSFKPGQSYPVSEFLFGFGFLTILIVEQVTLSCQENTLEENTPVIHTNPNPNSPERDTHGGHSNYGTVDTNTEVIVHQGHGPSSALRSLLLVLALSLHSVFEGLAIGLQVSNENVLRIFMAVAIHKSIIAFTLGLNLNHSDLRKTNVIKSNLFFSFMSPVGIVVGLLVVDFVKGMALAATSGVLQGIAAGTFLYVTLFEVLPPELNHPEDRLGKVLFVVFGFGFISLLLMVLPG